MIKDFDSLTIEYLEKFKARWYEVLEKKSCNQTQLVIGSRLRPQIVLWGYLAGVNWHENLNLQIPANIAVSVELLHKASLLLDDWLDDDDKRHSKNAFHTDFGEHITVMTAIKLVSESIRQLLVSDQQDSKKLILLNYLINTAAAMTDGVLTELELNRETMFNLDIIKHIAQMETSEIIGNSLLIGYTLNSNTNNTLASYLKKIGNLSGYLFQTLNDLESFSNVIINKNHKGLENFDFNRNRKNIVIAYMYSLLSDKLQQQMVHADVEYVISLYKALNIKILILREVELVFSEIEKLIHATVEYGAPLEWVEGYSWFLQQLKEVASKRVSWNQ
ncbi:MAG: class 1 isoprenoid biosynthesis enzyme [Lachnospiraceae bacterium]